MEFSGASWLQQQHVPDVHDGRTVAHDDWKEASTNVAEGPAIGQPSMDLSDFGLDIPAPSSSSTPITSSTPSYYTFAPHNGYFISGTPGPYNAVQYGSSQWSAPPQLPLSSYSSLNGATSTPSTSSQSGQMASSQPMMIDPSLTLNGANTGHAQLFSPPPYMSSQPQTRTTQPYTLQHPTQGSTISINPSFVHTTPSHFQQSQYQQPTQQQASQTRQSPPPQGTLSPYVLHPPNSGPFHGIPATSFYMNHQPAPSHVPTPAKPIPTSQPTPEQLKERFLTGLKPFLQPNAFSGAGAVTRLAEYLNEYGIMKVDVPTRLDILTKIRDNAPNHYFRAWMDNEFALAVLLSWLKEAYSAAEDSFVVTTAMPILHVMDRLPVTLATLRSSGMGKHLKHVSRMTSPAIQDMASNLQSKWRALLPPGKDEKEDAGKKRKAEATASKVPPAKKAAVTPNVVAKSATIVKKEDKPVAKEAAKGAKTDSAFFSAPKEKKQLPSFKKAPAATVKAEQDQNVAQPSSFNPFEEALKDMKGRKDSPATSTPPPKASTLAHTTINISTPTGLTKSGKPRKSVTWAPEGKLEMIKLIERAIYEDDPADGAHHTHNIRDLDRDEGAALHKHMVFEEQIDWYEPSLLEIPPDLGELLPKGRDSQEKATQEEREQTALGALYMRPEQIPESAAEPPSQIPEDQVDVEVKMMTAGPDVEQVFWNGGIPAALDTQGPSVSVAELVGQLSSAPINLGMDDSQPGAQGINFDLSGIGAEQLQQLLQQAQALSAVQAFAPPHVGNDPNWTAYPDYDRGYVEDGGRERRWSGEDNGGARGRGKGRGRGRGDGYTGIGRGDGGFRGSKRKPCSFFAQGRCRYGDQCDFSHETGPIPY